MKTTNKQLSKALQLQGEGKIDDAAQAFREILQRNPKDGIALFSLALINLQHHKNFNTALSLAEAGIEAIPNYAPMHALRADALQAAGQFDAAVASYERAIQIDPKLVVALTNCSVLLQHLSRHQEALTKLQQILRIEPDNPLALSNCGTLLTEFKQSKEAIKLFEHLLEVSPDFDYALGMLCFEKLHICDWSDIESLSPKIVDGLREGKRTCKSFPMMAISDDPITLHQSAKIFTQHKFPVTAPALWQGETYRHQKIRIAYISADLREHPVGHLMAGVIERHDKERFETIAISLGIDDGSSLRARFIAAFDQFYDAQKMSSLQIAQLLREQEVDIAINLSGYTSGSRSEIFALRPVPIQVNYLGYPGTLGADYIDYILADRHVAPFTDEQAYSEKIVHLPHSYLPTDGQLVVAERTPTRAECGLPDDAFIFCSFNHDYKISPQIFAIWMRLLKRVPGSVLWLMKLNELAKHNLCQEAERQGVEPSRLIFATRVPKIEDHLARYRQADVFLDCYPYNAHTTAADALFVGLPVITFMGHAFQGRVAGSLLTTLEIPELITHSLEDYEALAYRLANEPGRLVTIKAKLAEKRQTTALYDTTRFCRNLEAALSGMWERWQSGKAPEHFAVDEQAIPLSKSLLDQGKRLGSQAITHWAIQTKNGLQICVPPRLENMETYILLEQEDWFEDELSFVRTYIEAGMNAVDIGVGHGEYALNIAQAAPNGHLWAVDTASAAVNGDFLSKSIKLNNFHDRITTLRESFSPAQLAAPLDFLDRLDNQIGQQSIHFLRLNADSHDSHLIAGGKRFLTEQSPLVMFKYRQGKMLNLATIVALQQLDYRIYQLLPEHNFLIEFQANEQTDALNLFACKKDLAKQLQHRNLLALAEEDISAPGEAKRVTLDKLATQPFAISCKADWDEHASAVPIDYLDALASTLLSYKTDLSAGQKLGLINRAIQLIEALLAGSSGAHYSIWLLKIHLQHLKNQRTASTSLARQVLQTFQHTSIPAWPFLPPRVIHLSRPVNGTPETWLNAVLMEFIETRQSFSSYFVADPLPALQAQLGNNNHELDIERRFVLAAKKLGRIVTSPRGFPLLNPDQSANSAIWHQIMGSGFASMLLQGLAPVHIVDVGASTHGKLTEPYAPLIEMRAAKVTGFEPNKEECQRLNDLYAKNGEYRYYPEFVGKGGPATFYETNWYMTGSLYKPNESILRTFEQLGEVTQLKQEHPVNTVSLFELEDLNDIDMIKIDVQGAELDVFKGAQQKLDDVLVIWTEVEFVPLYENQPLFSDVDIYLRQKGFMFHTFEYIASRCFKPYNGLSKNRNGIRQSIWTDAIYIRDLKLLDNLSTTKLRKLASILDSIIKSYDFCLYVLKIIDRREGSDYSALYLNYRKTHGLM